VSTKPKTYGFYLLLTCLSFKLKEALTFFPPIFRTNNRRNPTFICTNQYRVDNTNGDVFVVA